MNKTDTQYYDTEQLASFLSVKPNWLRHNRSSKMPIPFIKIRHLVRYNALDVKKWLGLKQSTILLVDAKSVSAQFDLKISWLNHNRISSTPMPFYKLGKMVRYHPDEVKLWLENNKSH